MATRNDTNEQNKAADEAARTTRAVTDEAARVGEQTARAGADVARRGAEVARDTFQTGLNTANETFQRITDQFTDVLGFNGPRAEELARVQAGPSGPWPRPARFSHGVLRRSRRRCSVSSRSAFEERRGLNGLAGVRSVQDFVAVQSDLARDHLEQVIETNKRIAETSLRIAEEAARVIQAQGQANRRLPCRLDSEDRSFDSSMRPGPVPAFLRLASSAAAACHITDWFVHN